MSLLSVLFIVCCVITAFGFLGTVGFLVFKFIEYFTNE